MSAAGEIEVLRANAVLYECRDGVAVVALARPQTRNALSVEVLDGLAAAFGSAVDEGARALVITGVGRTFCAGGDLGGVVKALEGDIDVEIGALIDQFHDVIGMFRGLPLPTVAAVNGAAVGAGVALALAADVRVLARSASFTTGYVGVGATPDGGASFHLARALGAPQALSSFLLNRRFEAAGLLTCGLADEVVDGADLMATSQEVARRLAALSFPLVRAMRDLVYSASGQTLQTQLSAEKHHFVSIAHTLEFRNALASFAERGRALTQGIQ